MDGGQYLRSHLITYYPTLIFIFTNLFTPQKHKKTEYKPRKTTKKKIAKKRDIKKQIIKNLTTV